MLLYQIGIRCLVATRFVDICSCDKLYQIGIRCLVATLSDKALIKFNYIKLELDV